MCSELSRWTDKFSFTVELRIGPPKTTLRGGKLHSPVSDIVTGCNKMTISPLN